MQGSTEILKNDECEPSDMFEMMIDEYGWIIKVHYHLVNFMMALTESS